MFAQASGRMLRARRSAKRSSGDLLLAGRVLICPGNRHMMVRRMPRGDMAVLTDSAPVNGHRPSVDVLFHSVAQEFGLTSRRRADDRHG